MQNDWSFRTDNHICSLRCAGVLIRDDKLLLQRDIDGAVYALPGGHVKIGEPLQDGLVREFHEETQTEITCEKLLWSEECFWSQNIVNYHSITFYYLIRLNQPSALPDADLPFAQSDNKNVVFEWIPLDKLSSITVYPSFLPDEVNDISAAPKHFTTHC